MAVQRHQVEDELALARDEAHQLRRVSQQLQAVLFDAQVSLFFLFFSFFLNKFYHQHLLEMIRNRRVGIFQSVFFWVKDSEWDQLG